MARSIVERVGTVDVDGVGGVTVSAGVATYPVQGVGRDELIRLADSALYWAKEDGKNRARTYEPALVELKQLQQLAEGTDRAARYRAAASRVSSTCASSRPRRRAMRAASSLTRSECEPVYASRASTAFASDAAAR